MTRKTIRLPEALARLAAREAERRSVSLSELVSQALVAYLGVGGTSPRRLPFAALGASGHRNTARDLKQILGEEWAPHRPR